MEAMEYKPNEFFVIRTPEKVDPDDYIIALGKIYKIGFGHIFVIRSNFGNGRNAKPFTDM